MAFDPIGLTRGVVTIARRLPKATLHAAGYTLVPNRDRHLALWFTPRAIREHFEFGVIGDDRKTAALVRTASDDELREVADMCLTENELYELFHVLLRDAANEVLDHGDETPGLTAVPEQGFQPAS